MGGLFSSPKPPKMPEIKPVRMPTMNDPNAEKAAQRFRQEAFRRKGRQSTIMTDMLRDATGSSGQTLGK